MQKLSVVVPMYNEEDNIDEFFASVTPVLEEISLRQGLEWEIVAVDDGSTDGTERKLAERCAADARIEALIFSRNFGKEAAMSAGLEHASGDAVVVIDADLQHPPRLIEEMVRRWRAGAEVVVGVRPDRGSDSPLKRFTGALFYRVFNLLCTPHITANAGDFRLMDRRVVDALLRLPERNRFMKGLFAWVGFRVESIPLEHEKRRHGATKWSYRKLTRFALDGILSFSVAPLRLCFWMGLVVSCLAFSYGTLIVLRTLVYGEAVRGYPTIMVTVLFLGGVQMLGLGILGEYLGRVYQEVKQRPLYLLRRRYDGGDRPEDARHPERTARHGGEPGLTRGEDGDAANTRHCERR